MKTRIFLGLIAIGIFFGASCLKKQDLTSEDLGEAASPEAIAASINSGFGPMNYGDMKVNEFGSVILTQRVQDGATQTLEQQDLTIQSITDTSSTLSLNVLSTKTKYSGGQTTQSTRAWIKNFTKYSGFAFSNSAQTLAADDVDAPIFLFQAMQSLALSSCSDSGSYPETCHNLSASEINYKVPPTSAHTHQCTDIYNCFIKAKKIEFDLVRKYEIDSDGKPKRIHYTLVLSPNVPFTSRVLQYCSRTLYTIEGVQQKILADLCYNVNNYNAGN